MIIKKFDIFENSEKLISENQYIKKMVSDSLVELTDAGVYINCSLFKINGEKDIAIEIDMRYPKWSGSNTYTTKNKFLPTELSDCLLRLDHFIREEGWVGFTNGGSLFRPYSTQNTETMIEAGVIGLKSSKMKLDEFIKIIDGFKVPPFHYLIVSYCKISNNLNESKVNDTIIETLNDIFLDLSDLGDWYSAISEEDKGYIIDISFGEMEPYLSDNDDDFHPFGFPIYRTKKIPKELVETIERSIFYMNSEGFEHSMFIITDYSLEESEEEIFDLDNIEVGQHLPENDRIRIVFKHVDSIF